MNQDPDVRTAMLVCGAIVAGSMVLGVLLSVVVSNHSNKKLLEGGEGLHGTAKWATRKDIEASGLLDAPSGCYVGGVHESGKLHYMKDNWPGHILAFQPTQTGKTVGLVIPTLVGSWLESAVILDLKGELWKKTSGYRSTLGPCFKIDPTNVGSSRFNPLAEIGLWSPQDVADVGNIAEMLCKPAGDSEHEHKYFYDAATTLLSACILHCCYAMDRIGETANLSDIAAFLGPIDTPFAQSLESMRTAQHADADHEWFDGTISQTHPIVARQANEVFEKYGTNLDGVVSTARTAMKVFNDPLVCAATSASDFTVQDLVNHAQPVSLYLVVPPKHLKRLLPLLRLVFSVIVDGLTEKEVKNRHRLLLMIDEFPQMGNMPILGRGLSYVASYGIKVYLICQEIGQIAGAYGQFEAITGNCGVQIASAPNKIDTAEMLSRMIGRTTVQRADPSFSGPRLASAATMSVHMSYTERPLVTPDEFMRLKRPEKTKDGKRITAPGSMVVFVTGAPPIKATQMLYFRDPIMLRRSKLPPPTQMVMLQDGEVYNQPPLPRFQTITVTEEIEPETNIRPLPV